MGRLTRDGTAEPVSRGQFSGANADREMFIFPVQLTTTNLTRFIHTLTTCVIIHTIDYNIINNNFSSRV